MAAGDTGPKLPYTAIFNKVLIILHGLYSNEKQCLPVAAKAALTSLAYYTRLPHNRRDIF
jgi:hypothetical protein